MTNDSSLLAHLSSRFTERTEDIAVEALGYILSTSEAAKTGLLSILRSGGANVEELSRIDTQVSGKEGERPDLAGWDESGVERLLIEAKFWAGLTDNQPNAYLKRLDRGGVLLFVTPEERLDRLWPELEQRAEQGGLKWSADTDRPRAADVCGRRLILASWRTLLEEVEQRADAAGDSAAVASLRQLQGLCETQDEPAFPPLRSDELGQDVPRRLLSLRSVINRVVDKAKAAELVRTGGHGKKLGYDGFGQWLELGVWKGGVRVKDKPAGACLCVHYTAWSQHQETPVWLEFDQWKGVLPLKKVRKRLRHDIVVAKDGTHFVPIHLPTGVELDHVVDSVVGRLRDLAHRIAGVAAD